MPVLSKFKSFVFYGVILAAGLGAGLGAAKLPALLKADYVSANHAAYFPSPAIRVALYGTSTCAFCAKARAYLKERQITFADFDIETSEKARSEFKQLGGQGVPLLLIGDRRIEGYNSPVIDAALKKLFQ